MLRSAARMLMATLIGLTACSSAAFAAGGFVEPPKVVVADSDGDPNGLGRGGPAG